MACVIEETKMGTIEMKAKISEELYVDHHDCKEYGEKYF